MFKKKRVRYLFILLALTAVSVIGLGWYDVKKGDSFTLTNIPILERVKVYLKRIVFIIPELQSTVDEQRNELTRLKNLARVEKKYVNELWKILSSSNHEKINSYFISKKILKSNLDTYMIKLFSLPFPGYNESISKPAAYLEQTNEQIFLGTGTGEFFTFNKDITAKFMVDQISSVKQNEIELKRIESNIKDIVHDEEFYSFGGLSIKDLLILDNKIFVSYTKEQSENCYNTSILTARLNLTFLNFNNFFSYKECYMRDDFDTRANGGRMVVYKDNKILLTIGVGTWTKKTKKAQDKNSLFGKIISIDLKTKDHELISIGHRNPQGLYYSKEDDLIISTEHGPRGGDEININLEPDTNKIENYGWPISSYGEHYDKVYWKEAPLKKSHKKFGFEEPIRDFTPSIAISEIIKIPKLFNEKFINDFFVAAMGRHIWMGQLSIHHIRFSKNFDKIEFEEIIPINYRIRDMIFLNEQNIIALVLEDIPAIGFLKLIN